MSYGYDDYLEVNVGTHTIQLRKEWWEEILNRLGPLTIDKVANAAWQKFKNEGYRATFSGAEVKRFMDQNFTSRDDLQEDRVYFSLAQIQKEHKDTELKKLFESDFLRELKKI